MRVLVTGSQGFTGHYVTRQLLQAGHDVVGTATHLNDTRTADLFETKAMNLTNLDQVKRVVESVRPDAVIHLAAVSYVGHGAPAEFYTTNVLGTRNLLESLSGADLPLQNVILASSANVYGNSRQGVLTEDTPPAPANDLHRQQTGDGIHGLAVGRPFATDHHPALQLYRRGPEHTLSYCQNRRSLLPPRGQYQTG